MHFLASILSTSRITKKILFFLSDCLLIGLAFWLSIGLRRDVIGELANYRNWQLLCLLTLLSLLIFNYLGLYRTVIRYAGIGVVRQVLLGTLISTGVMLGISFVAHFSLPRSAPFVYFSLLSLFLIGLRFTVKGILQGEQKNRNRPILIYGAGAAGRQLYQTTMKIGDFLPIAFVDDSASLQQKSVHGLTVYSPNDLPAIIERFGIESIVLAMPNSSQEQRKAAFRRLSKTPCQIFSIPNMRALNLLGEAAGIRMLQKVSIIDLLGRDAIEPIPELMTKNVAQKHVMVTGAGGTIGSELCRQILGQGPLTIILYEISEHALYLIYQELTTIAKVHSQTVTLIPVTGNVNNKDYLIKLMTMYQIDTVYHAAAYKHVPLVEYNTIEGVQNNVMGTANCALAAIEAKVASFVLISTDKAVRPTNIMGATKRMAELVLQALADDSGHHTCFSMVRFGNVLGSSGSVIPLFEKQIAQGGPVTITHPEITRYFMTIPEAAQLVIQASALAEGGDVFLLDMGDPVKIETLAIQMIKLSGLSLKNDANPNGDIEIVTCGLRPGEKLFEELLISETAEGTIHSRIMTSKEQKMSFNAVMALLDQLNVACNTFNVQRLRALLLRAPLEFKPANAMCDIIFDQNNTFNL